MEHLIALPAPAISIAKDKFVIVDESTPARWRATGIRDLATKFLSEAEATLFAFSIAEETEVLPVEGQSIKTTKKQKKGK